MSGPGVIGHLFSASCGGSRYTVTIPDVFGEFSGIITVRALGNNTTTRTGPPARARFKRSPGD